MSSDSRRVFFALWPREASQTRLVDAARTALAAVRGGSRVKPANLHLTLAFLGAVPAAALEPIRSCALTIAEAWNEVPPDIEVTLDLLEYWGRSRVLCATSSRPSAPAAALASRLTAGLGRVGFRLDLKPFRAHVTLVRQLERRALDSADGTLRLPPVAWRFTDFALIESQPRPRGALYSVLDAWSLCRA